MNDTGELFESLAEGRYFYRESYGIGDRESLSERIYVDTQDEQLRQAYRNFREDWSKVSLSFVSVTRSTLRDYLAESSRGSEALFDVTALRKDLLVDTLAILLSHGSPSAYSFNILRQGDLKHGREAVESLLPRLAANDSYSYSSLGDSENVAYAAKRIHRSSLRFRSVIAFSLMAAILYIFVNIFITETWVLGIFAGLSSAAGVASLLHEIRRQGLR